MTLLLKTLAVLLALAVVLGCGAVALNGVPLLAPPGPAERLRVYLSRNSARTRLDSEFPELRTRSYDQSREDMYQRVKVSIAALGWRVKKADPAGYTIDAVVSTPLLRFKDDVRVMVERAADGETLVDIASRSRVGRADFGANIGHVMALYEALGGAS